MRRTTRRGHITLADILDAETVPIRGHRRHLVARCEGAAASGRFQMLASDAQLPESLALQSVEPLRWKRPGAVDFCRARGEFAIGWLGGTTDHSCWLFVKGKKSIGHARLPGFMRRGKILSAGDAGVSVRIIQLARRYQRFDDGVASMLALHRKVLDQNSQRRELHGRRERDRY